MTHVLQPGSCSLQILHLNLYNGIIIFLNNHRIHLYTKIPFFSRKKLPLWEATPCWRHQITFSALLALCAGNSPVTSEFPSQRPVTRSIDVFYGLRLNKRLSKQSYADDLWCHPAHYDVTVMLRYKSRLAPRLHYMCPLPIQHIRWSGYVQGILSQ